MYFSLTPGNFSDVQEVFLTAGIKSRVHIERDNFCATIPLRVTSDFDDKKILHPRAPQLRCFG